MAIRPRVGGLMDWDAIIGGLMSSPLLLLAMAVIGKL